MRGNKTLTVSITISITDQSLTLWQDGQARQRYSVSTGLKGSGNQKGSEQTPLGEHVIRAKIGADSPIQTVFVGRRPTGELYSDALEKAQPKRDWVLTRIMWLSGLEVGQNRLGNVDTMQRYIYIHGTPDSEPMGVAKSHGCIRMRNQDIIDLFEQVAVGTKVTIQP